MNKYILLLFSVFPIYCAFAQDDIIQAIQEKLKQDDQVRLLIIDNTYPDIPRTDIEKLLLSKFKKSTNFLIINRASLIHR